MYSVTQAFTPAQGANKHTPTESTGNPSPAPSTASPQSQNQNQNSNSNPEKRGLNARSCVTCRRRKVKCNKENPCSNCTKAGTTCVFPAPGRAPRRPRANGGTVASEREAELLKRLRRLEGVVDELSGQVEVEGLVQRSPGSERENVKEERGTVRVVGMDEGGGGLAGNHNGSKSVWIGRAFRIGEGPPRTAFSADGEVASGIGRLVLDEGKTSYVASPFWTSITEEMEEIRGALDDQEFDSDSDAPIPPHDNITEPNHQSFIMGYSSSDVDLKQLHPLPSQIPFYWQTFLENVQPLVKIVHTPTMNKVIKQVQTHLDSLSKSTEALMFSIYFATVTSMTAEEVMTNLGIDKETLLKQYRFGVEQALARASFLNTNEIVTVQAFILFLVCVRRHDDTRFVWSLTGLALRIAQSLGLHRDGTQFGLSPFDVEMRRRLWWQVCILDTRASEDHGSEPSIIEYSFDTEFPLNINDSDLDPDATEPPMPHTGVSEMTFCLIRYEICNLTRRLTYTPPGNTPCKQAGYVMSLEDKEGMIREAAAHLETKYLQYCNDAGPLYWVAATVARLIVAKMSLIIYHPFTQPGKPNSLSQDIKDRLFMASIEIIEYSRILESEASTKQWGWLFHTYIQWHAIAYILGELCVRNASPIVDRAWRTVENVFDDWGGRVARSKSGMLWQPMRKLMARARRRREENSKQSGVGAGGGGGSFGGQRVFSAYAPSSLTSPPLPHEFIQTSPSSNISYDNIPMTSNPNPNPIPAPQMGHMINMMAPESSGVDWITGVGLDGTGLNSDIDMDVAAVEWEGWDEMVRDFANQGEGGGAAVLGEGGEVVGPTLGGLGNWW